MIHLCIKIWEPLYQDVGLSEHKNYMEDFEQRILNQNNSPAENNDKRWKIALRHWKATTNKETLEQLDS